MRPLYHTRVSTCNALGLLVEQTLVALRVEQALDGLRHEAPADPRVALIAGEVNRREAERGAVGCESTRLKARNGERME